MISDSTHSMSSNFINATETYRANMDEKRNNAMVAGVHVSNAQHKQKQADIYISSMDDNSTVSSSSSSNSVDPYDAYRAAMKYQNKQDFISALEQAGDGDFTRPPETPPDIENMI